MAESSNLDRIVVERQEIERGMEDIDMGPLYEAISDNNWPAAERFIHSHPVDFFNVEYWSSKGRTPLHVAAGFGHEGIVQGLVQLVASEYVEIHDALGKTPLIVVAEVSGVIPIAECLINKNNKVLEISAKRDGEDLLPVQWAIFVGHKEMGRYLYEFTPPQLFRENQDRASSFLTLCLTNGVLDIAFDLLENCEELLFAKVDIFYSTIEFIAIHLPDSSLDKSQLPFWKRCVYDYVQQHGENNIAHQGMKEIYQMKQQHAQASKILNLICKNVKSLNKDTHSMTEDTLIAAKSMTENALIAARSMTEDALIAARSMTEDAVNAARSMTEDALIAARSKTEDALIAARSKTQDELIAARSMTEDALMAAAKIDKVEFLLQVIKANPEILLAGKFELFFDAVRHRRAAIFNLLRGFSFKHVVASITEDNEIKLLHLATSLAPSSYLNQVSGAALQMQRELQWFKETESMVDPAVMNLQNKMNLLKSRKLPLDHFKDNHRELRKEGERWMKDTATSCSVVGTLIVTIMFAVAFTVPGGNHQDSGYPIFLEDKLFKVFLISDALSMFSSTTSVLTFLGILTSHYEEEDFLYSLPNKLIIGLSTLLLSIATMTVAFSVTIIIMLQHNSSRLRAILPIAVLAGIPIISFVSLQFRVLVQVISSTYVRGTFKKKADKWL